MKTIAAAMVGLDAVVGLVLVHLPTSPQKAALGITWFCFLGLTVVVLITIGLLTFGKRD